MKKLDNKSKNKLDNKPKCINSVVSTMTTEEYRLFFGKKVKN